MPQFLLLNLGFFKRIVLKLIWYKNHWGKMKIKTAPSANVPWAMSVNVSVNGYLPLLWTMMKGVQLPRLTTAGIVSVQPLFFYISVWDVEGHGIKERVLHLKSIQHIWIRPPLPLVLMTSRCSSDITDNWTSQKHNVSPGYSFVLHTIFPERKPR